MKNLIITILAFSFLFSRGQNSNNFNLDVNTIKRKLVFFELNQYKLSSESKLLLDSLAAELSGKEYSLRLIGHADSLGESDANLKLSVQRTREVTVYLLSRGLDSIKIKQEFVGEWRPLFQYDSTSFGNKNRCVEVISSCYCTPINSKINESVPLTSKFENDTTIRCRNGTEIIIPAGAFYPRRLSEITFNVKEEFTICEILKGTSTFETDDGNCLSSAGMIYIKPMLDTVEIQPNKGQLVTIKIPLWGGRPDPLMKVYFAVIDSLGKKVWKPQESELTYENVGTQYYVFRVDTLIGFNLDKLMGIKCQKNGPQIKVKGFKDVEVYQVYPNEVYLSRGQWNKKQKVYVIDSVIPAKNPELIVMAFDKKGKAFVAKGPLLKLEFNKRKKYYLVNKDYFKPLERTSDGKQSAKDDLCRFINK